MSSEVRIGRIDHGVRAEGPGSRTVVWFQGCTIRCPGCINPHLFSSKGGFSVSAETIAERAKEHGDEGLTLIGGEPFDQPKALRKLVEAAHRHGLGVICFTGYRVEELRMKGDEYLQALQSIDLLIDGRYEREQPEDSRSLVGSKNQRFIELSTRYKNFDPATNPNKVELRISSAGKVSVAGFLDDSKLAEFVQKNELKISRKRE